MKNIILTLTLLCSLMTQAQPLSTVVAWQHGVRPSSECDGSLGYWCLYEGEPVIMYSTTAYGLKSALDEWADLSVKLRESYGEPKVITQDVEIPSYVNGLQDYGNMNMATRVGSGWVEFSRMYTTPNGNIVVILVLNQEDYMVMVISG